MILSGNYYWLMGEMRNFTYNYSRLAVRANRRTEVFVVLVTLYTLCLNFPYMLTLSRA
jgi:hypothetical protein